MRKTVFAGLGAVLLCAAVASAAGPHFRTDAFRTSSGELVITVVGHATLMMTWGGKVLHIDPVTEQADYTKLPKADLILVTHEHADHLDPAAIGLIRTQGTAVLAPETAARRIPGAVVLRNGDVRTIQGVRIEAVPAYNLVHMRKPGVPFHPRGIGNGYIVTFGDTRVYIAGDTENTPEMKRLKGIDIAFLPMNRPYTMTPEMVADAAKAFRPKILYPYHTGGTDTGRLVNLLRDAGGIDLRTKNP
jgi:L-ascorbate metabolism protein UlaG (beta-lactamase superfamily)